MSQVQASQSGVFLKPKIKSPHACCNRFPYLVLVRRSYGIVLCLMQTSIDTDDAAM